MNQKKLAFIGCIILVPLLFVGYSSLKSDSESASPATLQGRLTAIRYVAKKKPVLISQASYQEASRKDSEPSAAKDLEQLRGKPVILHFWAEWCGSCVQELPSYDTFAEMYGKSFHVLAVTDDTPEGNSIRNYYKDNNIRNLPLAIDVNETLKKKFKPQGLPTTIFLNAEGEEIGRILGPVEWSGTGGAVIAQFLNSMK